MDGSEAVVLAATSEAGIEKSDRACHAAAQGLNGAPGLLLGIRHLITAHGRSMKLV